MKKRAITIILVVLILTMTITPAFASTVYLECGNSAGACRPGRVPHTPWVRENYREILRNCIGTPMCLIFSVCATVFARCDNCGYSQIIETEDYQVHGDPLCPLG